MNNITGVEELLNRLNTLGGNVEETLYSGISKQVMLVQGEAKELCPEDLGDLRNSIKTDTKKKRNKIVGSVYTNSDHAVYVEFGTGKVGERTNTNTEVNVSYKQDKWKVNIPDVGVRWIEGQPAQPYLYPAIKNNETKIIDNIKEDLKNAIREVSIHD